MLDLGRELLLLILSFEVLAVIRDVLNFVESNVFHVGLLSQQCVHFLGTVEVDAARVFLEESPSNMRVKGAPAEGAGGERQRHNFLLSILSVL